MEDLRCFIAITPDQAAIAYLQIVRSQIEPHVPAKAIRWVNSSQAHLTLRFLGDVASENIQPLQKAVAGACSGTAPFVLMPDEIGAFPRLSRPKVLWIGLSGDVSILNLLQQKIARAVSEFSQEKEELNFTPHLTLGRTRSIPPRELRETSNALRALRLPPAFSWTVRHVQLIQSSLGPDGAMHQPIATTEL